MDPIIEVVLAAAGRGRRLGTEVPKAFVEVAGAPLLAHALRGALSVGPRRIAIAVPPEQRRWAQAVRELGDERVEAVAGERTRQQSVRAALGLLRRRAESTGQLLADVVVVHDAARPCAGASLWWRVVEAAVAHGAAIPVLPVVDCLKRLDADDAVVATIERDRLVRAQTPQGFRFDWLWRAHESAATTDAPDDAALVEGIGRKVATVAGEVDNIKVTKPEDLSVVAATLARATTGLAGDREGRSMRVGFGYDVHPLVEGRRLVLGGVEIDHARGLEGHSDADALAHAVADALLGAAALGDIGMHFPAEEERWKDADSLDLLARVGELLRDAGFRPRNIDATVIAEEPRLAQYLGAMRERLASAVGLEPAAVSVKATRAEGIGALGRAAGIAVHAVASIDDV